MVRLCSVVMDVESAAALTYTLQPVSPWAPNLSNLHRPNRKGLGAQARVRATASEQGQENLNMDHSSRSI